MNILQEVGSKRRKLFFGDFISFFFGIFRHFLDLGGSPNDSQELKIKMTRITDGCKLE